VTIANPPYVNDNLGSPAAADTVIGIERVLPLFHLLNAPEAAGQTDFTRGLWYAFTVGAMRVVSLANDDVTYQDGGGSTRT
jgi:hypothetical protein